MLRRLQLYGTIASLGMVLLQSMPSNAQVSVAPTALFLSEEERFGAIFVANQSSAPQEVTVGFRFGYPAADSLGSVYVEYEDTTAASKYSLAPFVRAFPRRFILPPGESQVVRLTARPSAEHASRWLWTRVLTTSTPQVTFQDTTTTGVQPRVVFRLQQVTALFYGPAEQTTSVAIDDLAAHVDSNEVVVLATFSKEEGRPFFGTAVTRVRDDTGRQLAEQRNPLAIYVSERRRFAISLPDNSSSLSDLQVEITLTDERTDVPPRFLSEITPISRVTEVGPSPPE